MTSPDLREAAQQLVDECLRIGGECAVCTMTWDSERMEMEHEAGCYAEALRTALGASPAGEPSEQAIQAARTALWAAPDRDGEYMGLFVALDAALRAAYAIDGLRTSSPAPSDNGGWVEITKRESFDPCGCRKTETFPEGHEESAFVEHTRCAKHAAAAWRERTDLDPNDAYDLGYKEGIDGGVSPDEAHQFGLCDVWNAALRERERKQAGAASIRALGET